MLRTPYWLDWFNIISGTSLPERRVWILCRQVDELQEQVEKLKAEVAAKDDDTGSSSMKALELQNSKHLELVADLKLQLEQVHFLSSFSDATLGNCKASRARRMLTQ